VPPCPFAVWGVPPIWKQWHTAAPGNVWTYHCGAPHGRSRMADFELRPASLSLNPILRQMNGDYLAMPDDWYPPYFSVRASLPLTPGFDGAVNIDSASLNGAIPTRTIKAFHEDLPSQPQTAVYFSRFFGDLDLNTAYPKWCMPHETRVAHVLNHTVDPGDVINPNAGPDYVGNVTENQTFEMYLSTKGAIPFDNSSDVTPVPTDAGGNPVLVGNERVRIPIDALGPARIAVHTPLDLPALRLTLTAPGGGAARAEYREDTHGWTRVQQFTLPTPGSGEYWLNIGPTAYATPFVALGSWESSHQFTLATDKPSYPPGEVVTLRASLSGVGPDTVVEVVAYVPTKEGPRVALPMTGQNGSYTAKWTAPLDAGTFPVTVSAQGYTTIATAGGRGKSDAFLRELPLYVLVQEPAGKPVDAVEDASKETPLGPATGKPTERVTPDPVRTEATIPGSVTPSAESRDVPGMQAVVTLIVLLAVALLARSGTGRAR
ncbi:MAG TPA: hypothetical protein VNZ52_14040, partial [Candidatus Thermoplasmatota archaeon]|nr:hypothetical protein [Candidatus Thermoplasmatota archaeon]